MDPNSPDPDEAVDGLGDLLETAASLSTTIALPVAGLSACLAFGTFLFLAAAGCLVTFVYRPISVLEHSDPSTGYAYLAYGAFAVTIGWLATAFVWSAKSRYADAAHRGRDNAHPLTVTVRQFPATVAARGLKVLLPVGPGIAFLWGASFVVPEPVTPVVTVVTAVAVGALYLRLHFADLAVLMEGLGPLAALRRAWRLTGTGECYGYLLRSVAPVLAIVAALVAIAAAPLMLGAPGDWSATVVLAWTAVTLVVVIGATTFAGAVNYLVFRGLRDRTPDSDRRDEA